MIFLIVYDRNKGTLQHLTSYTDEQIKEANDDRLSAEIENADCTDVEIVILRSVSKDELKRTHGRYFKTLPELERLR